MALAPQSLDGEHLDPLLSRTSWGKRAIEPLKPLYYFKECTSLGTLNAFT